MENIKHSPPVHHKAEERLPVTFEDLNLNPKTLSAVKELGFTELTPIQQKCIPPIQQGKDVVGQSSTGSGKTAAFGLPIIEKIRPGSGVQVLILTPTRELCVQVAEAMKKFGKYMHIKVAEVYGGVSISPQMQAIKRADIVVGTPGRILDHIDRRTISFEGVSFLVLDEADRMFDMGFIEDVEKIISYVPRKRQTMLFSATINPDVHRVVQKHLNLPVNVKVQTHVDKAHLRQVYYDVKFFEKFSLLVHLLKNKTPGLALVFCATRREVEHVTRNLQTHKIRALAIHGGLTQNRRLEALESLKSEHTQILVATDVAARGLDIKNVSHVYNYDAPKSAEEYVHRIGRTARAGMTGDAVTLLTEKDYDNFSRILSDPKIEIKKEAPIVFEQVSFDRGQSFRGRGGGGNRQQGRGGYHGRRGTESREQGSGYGQRRRHKFLGRGHIRRGGG